MAKVVDTTKEGWSNDITGTSGRLRHYYKGGVSLCGKWKQKFFFNHFDTDTLGSRNCGDCSICIGRLKKDSEIKK